MNKYQEAFKALTRFTERSTDFKNLIDRSEYYKHKNLLKKLVNKEEPMILDYEADGYADGVLVYDTAICRSCGRHFEVDFDEHYKYCPSCGQKLDWRISDV